MALRRVLMYYTDAAGSHIAERLLQHAEIGGGMAYGELDDTDIPSLREANVVVDWLEEPSPPLVDRPRNRAPRPTVRSGSRAIGLDDVLALAAPTPLRVIDVYVLRLVGPLLPRWRDRLRGEEAELLEYKGGFSWTTRLRLAQVPPIQSLDFVSELRQYALGDTVHPEQYATRGGAAVSEQELTFELITHRDGDVEAVTTWLEASGLTPLLVAGRKVRFRGFRGGNALRELAHRPEVSTLYEYVRPVPFNDHARVVVGVEPRAGASPATALALEGNGQIVGVSDTGLDDQHVDFGGRVKSLLARGRPGLTDDPDGHGTHVAGSIVGTGAASNGAIRGMAPQAELVVQSLLDPTGQLDLDPSAADVLEESYKAGARIHNASWGVSGNGSSYRAESREVDEFVHDHPDLLVVVAAGNDGSAETGTGPVGWVELMSVSAPATAKNGLTVGASRTDRNAIGRTIPTWGGWNGPRFPDPPIQNELMSGDPESMAALSSRGPCEDQARVKPDVVAPGTYILSTRASGASLPFWADYPANPGYAFHGGTSMAAPIVSGCAALVRQYFEDERGHTPSAALLKAVLAAGARPLTGADSVATYPGPPNFHQGFGCVSLSTSIPNPSAPDMDLDFRDVWDADDDELADSLSGIRFTVSTDGTVPLRVGLAWTDPPGDHLQNVLQLLVGHSASLQTWWGNATRPSLVRGEAGRQQQPASRTHRAAAVWRFRPPGAGSIARGSRAAVRACGHRPPHRSARRSRTLLRWGPTTRSRPRCGARGRRSRHTRTTTPRRHLTRRSPRWNESSPTFASDQRRSTRGFRCSTPPPCCYSSTRRSPVTRALAGPRSLVSKLRCARPRRRGPIGAALLANLGRGLREKHALTRDPSDLSDAVARLQEALAATSEDSDDWAMYAASLADALHERVVQLGREPTARAEQARLLDIAATLAERALAATDVESPRWPERANALGDVRFGQFLLDGGDLDAAASLFREAAARAPEGSYDQTVYQRNLGHTLGAHHALTGDERALEEGSAALEETVQRGLEQAPEQALSAGMALGDWATRLGAWAVAAGAYERALQARTILHHGQRDASDQEDWLGRSIGLPARAAYALARTGRSRDAVVALEHGLAMLLSERLSQIPAAAPPDLEELQELASRRKFVYLVASELGGVALLVVPSEPGVEAIWLPELTTAAVAERVARYSAAYAGWLDVARRPRGATSSCACRSGSGKRSSNMSSRP